MQKHVQKKEINLEVGYIYNDKHGETRAMGNELPFGGNLSVRFPVGEKILFSFGHDECILTKIPSPRSAGLDAMEKDPLCQKMMGPG